jgi:hypothetical protein
MATLPLHPSDTALLREAVQSILNVVEASQSSASAKLQLEACTAIQNETYAFITHMTLVMGVPPKWFIPCVAALVEAVLHMAECTDTVGGRTSDWDLACEAVSDSAFRLLDHLPASEI